MALRRRLCCALVVSLAAPAPAHAGVAAVEGTAIVYRGDSRRDAFYAEGSAEAVTFRGEVTAGPGCGGDPVVCPAAGVTALRIAAGDGDDDVGVSGPLPVVVDLGPGADEFDVAVPEGVRPQALTLSAGDGDDRVGVAAHAASVDLGPGDDDLQVGNADSEQITGTFAVNGGPGDDDLTALPAFGGGPIDWVCGAGRDKVWVGPRDRVGDSCAPAVTGLVERTSIGRFARGRLALRAGMLAAPATVTIRLKSAARPYKTVASDRYRARADIVRRSLRLRPVRSRRVEATFTTRTRGERTVLTLDARITSRRPGP